MNRKQMKPKKAIRILTQLKGYPITAYGGEDIDALKIAIEALKCLSLLHGEELRGMLLMVRNELCFGGDWETAIKKIDKALSLFPLKEEEK